MKSATYGRMRIGKCITAEEVSGLGEDNKRYFGCSTDVMDILEDKCSVKSECEVRVADADLDRTQPCLPGLKLYLEASYECIQGEIILIFINQTIFQVNTIRSHLLLLPPMHSPCFDKTQSPWKFTSNTQIFDIIPSHYVYVVLSQLIKT